MSNDAVASGRRLEAAVEDARAAIRREEGGRQVPLGKKAARTRARILGTAYEAFVDGGYQATTVGVIAERAGVSLGTVYQYFSDRAAIMATLVGEAVLASVVEGGLGWVPATGREGVARIVGWFVQTYADTARFQAVWEEVAHVDEGLASLRRDLARVYVAGTAAEIERGQEAGVVARHLDAWSTASALQAMVDRHCYLTYVFDPPDPLPSVAETTDLLTDLWVGALGLSQET